MPFRAIPRHSAQRIYFQTIGRGQAPSLQTDLLRPTAPFLPTIPVGNGLAPFRHHLVGNGLAPFRTISRHSAPFLAIPNPTDKLSNHRKGPSPFPTNGPIEIHRAIPPHHPRREWPCAIPHHSASTPVWNGLAPFRIAIPPNGYIFKPSEGGKPLPYKRTY